MSCQNCGRRTQDVTDATCQRCRWLAAISKHNAAQRRKRVRWTAVGYRPGMARKPPGGTDE